MTNVSPLSLEALERGLTPHLKGYVHYFPELTSTQDAAREAALGGALEGETFLADEQSAGRGRFDRRWIAPPRTCVLVSVVLRPQLDAAAKLPMVAALAVLEAIEQTTGIRGDIKWPNDVLLNERKVAGILVETEFAGDIPQFAVVGIGLNVSIDADALEGVQYPATSLLMESGRIIEREAVAADLLNSLMRWYWLAQERDPSVFTAWRERLNTLGKHLQARVGEDVLTGIAVDIEEDGSLLLRRDDDGSLISLVAGEVTLQV